MHFTHCNQPNYTEFETEMDGDKRWYLIRDDVKYPSVTTMLGHAPKPWLTEWRDSMGHEAADIETKRCAARGEAVHLMAERYLDNQKNPTNEQELVHIKVFNQLKMRLNTIGNIRAQEIPLFSDALKLAGRVDLVAEYNGTLSVIDFKTSNNPKDLGMVQDYFLQCTAYALMYHEMFDTQINQIVVMIAVERGMAPMIYVKSIDEYVEPLVERINTYYAETNK